MANSKISNIGFQGQLSLNAGQKYSATLSTFIKQPFVTKIFVLSNFQLSFYTGFTVVRKRDKMLDKPHILSLF